jgi:ribosomal protein S18 acetylase RimI-like enzyme
MDSRPDVAFRPSRAQDAAASAPLVHASGPDSFDYVFATPRTTALGFLRQSLALPEGEFGYGTHVVGEWEGRIVACGAGWQGGGGWRFWLTTARPVVAYMGLRGTPAAYRRGMQAEAVMPGPERHEYYVGHLGIDPALRAQGIGENLIAALLTPARTKGARVAVLDVSVENPRAQALYERLGFRVTQTRPSHFAHAYGRIPPHRRMEKALTP